MTDYLKELEFERDKKEYLPHEDDYFLRSIAQAKIEGYKIGKAEKCKDTEDKFIEWLKDYKNSGIFSAIKIEIIQDKIKELSNIDPILPDVKGVINSNLEQQDRVQSNSEVKE